MVPLETLQRKLATAGLLHSFTSSGGSMKFTRKVQRGVALVAAGTAATLLFTGCSAGSLGQSGEGGGEAGTTEITFLTGSEDTDVASAKAIIESFQAANPDIKITHETRPGGSEGDNLVKTRLATGEMPEVFVYNIGSLLAAIKPAQNLQPMDDQPWANQLDQTFKDAASVE